MSSSGSFELFADAHHFQVRNINITAPMPLSSKSFDLLCENVAAEAVHNAGERCDAPKCHPETRVAVQEEILSWISCGHHDSQPKKILWLTGPAGSGKTAIAGALQTLRGPILSAIERDPHIFSKGLRCQCRAFLLKPFHEKRGSLVQSALPRVIIIDGLDEVGAPGASQLSGHEARLANEEDQVDILATLLQAAEDPRFPFRIIIASRPEPAIRTFFTSQARDVSREAFLGDKYDPHADITLFLQAKFTEVRRRYKLPVSWPGREVLEELRSRASGQFIYAATVARFLRTSRMHPQARLDCVLDLHSFGSTGDITHLSPLDTLYAHILKSSPDPASSVRWICAIKRLGSQPASFVRLLLQKYNGEADYLLENLASLLFTPSLEDEHKPFHLYHSSFIDFLRDRRRCGWRIHEAFMNAFDFVTIRCVQILSAKRPAVSLTDSEWLAFIPQFLQTIFLHFPPNDGPAENALAACDVQWWVSMIHASAQGDTMEGVMGRLFDVVHQKCPSTDRLLLCRDSCKHWRANILAGCRALGYRVPNAIALLRHRLCREITVNSLAHGAFCSLDAYFEPPKSSGPTATPSVKQSREEFIPLTTGNEDYDSICRLADCVYTRLSYDWRERYSEELRSGRSAYNALQSDIRRITLEMGVDIEDFDCTPHFSPW
ncbi:hypothetical protein NMY22_g10950 [Coprinellus aureogranulatus]|nr:hypothetical protein NMY22_g10950 [Coprinellus aureogranulatus]